MGGILGSFSSMGSGMGSLLGMAISSGSQILGGASASEEGKAVSDAYKANADIAIRQSQNFAAQEKDKFRKLASAQRAAYGASGLDVNAGSPLDVLADTDAESAVSVMQLLYGGQLEAANWRLRADVARSQGQSGLASGILGGTTNIISGLSRMGFGGS